MRIDEATAAESGQNEHMTHPAGQGRTDAVEAPSPSLGTLASPRNQPGSRRGLGRLAWLALTVLVVGLLGLIAVGILSRHGDQRSLGKTTEAAAVPTVDVTHPAATTTGTEISLPGNTQAFLDTPIYARTSGYLKKWYFDIGAHVQKGQLMATIETPELDEQLQVAQANLKSAQADLDLANITLLVTRICSSRTRSRSRKPTRRSEARARRRLRSMPAMANVRRLQQLQSFEKVYAPYSGTVTVRNTDVGDLIDAGSGSAPKELFHLASAGTIRVFVSVPEVYSASIHDGSTASLTLDEYPGQQFQAGSPATRIQSTLPLGR